MVNSFLTASMEQNDGGLRARIRLWGGSSENAQKFGTSILTQRGTLQGGLERHMLVKACEEGATNGVCREITPGIAARAVSIFEAVVSSPLIVCTDAASFSLLCRFALASAFDPDVVAKTTISVGFGASVEETPLRVPAYTVPAMKLVESLSSLDLPLPRVRLFAAVHSGIAINKFDEDSTWLSAVKMFVLTKMYLEEFFPRAGQEVVYDFDRPVEDGTAEYVVAKKLLAHMTRQGRGPVKEALDVLRKRGADHGGLAGEEQALLYTVLHPLLFPDILVTNGAVYTRYMQETDPDPNSFYFSIGGPPEMAFNLARRYLWEEAKDILGRDAIPLRSIRLITPVGRNPVYYAQGKKDFLLGQAREKWFDWKQVLLGKHPKPKEVRATWDNINGDQRFSADWNAIASKGGKPLKGKQFEEALCGYLRNAWLTEFFFEYVAGYGKRMEELLGAALLGSKKAQSFFGSHDGFSMLETLKDDAGNVVPQSITDDTRRELSGP